MAVSLLRGANIQHHPDVQLGELAKNVWILLQLGFAIVALQILDHKQNVGR